MQRLRFRLCQGFCFCFLLLSVPQEDAPKLCGQVLEASLPPHSLQHFAIVMRRSQGLPARSAVFNLLLSGEVCREAPFQNPRRRPPVPLCCFSLNSPSNSHEDFGQKGQRFAGGRRQLNYPTSTSEEHRLNPGGRKSELRSKTAKEVGSVEAGSHCKPPPPDSC